MYFDADNGRTTTERVMKIPPIDLSKLVQLLKSEGKAELTVTRTQSGTAKAGCHVLSNPFHPLLLEWDNIIVILEKEVIPLLNKGCEVKALATPAQKLAKSVGSISLMASQVLGFVPGPIGIICSIVNAIVCFSTGNVVGGFFELLGCIPGGKVAGKASSKLFPKIEKILIEVVESNHSLKVVIETSTRQQKAVTEFFKKYGPKAKPKNKPEVGQGYGVRNPAQEQPSALEQSLSNIPNSMVEAQKEIGKYTTLPNTYGNMYKTNLWPNLWH